MLWRVLVILLVLQQSLATRNFGIISSESDKTSCIDDDIEYEFITVESVYSVASNNSLFMVCPEKLDLSNVIRFAGVTNLTFGGRVENKTEIHCSSNGGFVLEDSRNIRLRFLRLYGCSGQKNSGGHFLRESAVLLLNCVNVSLYQLEISNSTGTGLLLNDTKGIVEILNCSFEDSRQHMSVHSHRTSENSVYKISNCSFLRGGSKSAAMNGGGLEVVFNSSQHAEVFISGATFSSNDAHKGGGMSVIIRASRAVVNVTDSEFKSNTAEEGGGVYVSMSGKLASRNVSFTRCNFFFNNALTLGGGLKISSSKLHNDSSFIVFTKTDWDGNRALYGSALCAIPETKNISELRGFLPMLKFHDTSFTSNIVRRNYLPQVSSFVEQYVEGRGAVYCIEFELHFYGSLSGSKSNGSAFHMEFNTIYFMENTRATFAENSGHYSGAMYLLLARIVVDKGAELHFISNMANHSGGAIHYYSFSSVWTNFSDSCCISKKDESSFSGIVFNFTNNNNNEKLNGEGSIHINSLVPCLQSFGLQDATHHLADSEVFKHVGNFSFSSRKNINIDTAVRNFTISNLKAAVTEYFAGKGSEPLMFESWTDLKRNQTRGRFVAEMENDKDICPFPGILVTRSSIRYYYNINHGERERKVLISTLNARTITTSFKIKMVNCPAGFMIDKKTCVCNTAQPNNNENFGISCKESSDSANRSHGVWMNLTVNQPYVEAGYCPPGYCSCRLELKFSDEVGSKLDICTEGREGRLCGKCKLNYSVFYHKKNFGCGNEHGKLCYYGWFFFILSEIVPVTLTFVAVMCSDRLLSSGPINGLLFYAQVVLMLRLSGEEYLELSDFIKAGQEISSLFYGVFNLDFFVHDKLSFCLWKGATYFGIMWTNFFTRLYSLVLICLTIAVLKYSHKLYSVAKLLKIRYPSIHKSSIHGVTAFLILTYSKNVTLSLTLLRPGYIYSSSAGNDYTSVIFYMGMKNHSNREVIPLVLVACFSLFFTAIIPTFLLILYPLHYKVLSIAGLSESKHVKKLISPLEKIKPIFDSFQSTFKDSLRFFSGLYFLYRFLIALTFVVNTPSSFYIVIEVILVVILVIHSVCQPHRKKLHNVVDSLLFGNLLLINTLSIFHLHLKNYPMKWCRINLKVMSSANQLVLVCLPFMVLLGIMAQNLAHYIKRWRGHKSKVDLPKAEDLDSLMELESVHKLSSGRLNSDYLLHRPLDNKGK